MQYFYSVTRQLQNLPRNGSQNDDTCFFLVHVCYRKGFSFLVHSYKIQDGFSRSLNPWNTWYRGWWMFKCIFQLHLAADSTVAGAGWVRSSVHCGERTRVERDRCGSSSSKIDSLRVSRSGLEQEMKHRNHMKGDLCVGSMKTHNSGVACHYYLYYFLRYIWLCTGHVGTQGE